ncbi:uncharacterized protein LOC108102093 [Drosophila ficusphila]|uniref:uncharacterized protein LOC108102093 n=1 Tax=Drosophila ficusphila TaxID=30025 RepID=UPI0007E6FF58|nr:uncharacterized protein LOC108102093 [Drosophila ficusphila]
MELRSRTHNKLVEFLRSAGVYENGMEVEEMRELVDTIERSAITETDDPELERALQESEMEFLASQPSALHNSTMIMSPQLLSRNSEGLDSPPSEPVRLTIRALVHHAMDWSPTAERRIPARKRSAEVNNQIIESDGKRSRPAVIQSGQNPQDQDHDLDNENPDASLVSQGNDGDSGVNWDEVSFSSASESSSLFSIGEMPDRHLISTSSVAVSDLSE